MGIERYLISSSLIGVLAQRLVRKICTHCKTSYKPTRLELQRLSFHLPLSYKSEGCKQCLQSGYSGRRAIFEWLEVDEELRQLMMQNVDSQKLAYTAVEKGMKSLRFNGIQLVHSGITTPFELIRVLG